MGVGRERGEEGSCMEEKGREEGGGERERSERGL